MKILAANLVFRLVAACKSIVEPMSTIHGVTRRCASAIGLGMSGLYHRLKGGGGILCSTQCTLYNGFGVHLKAEPITLSIRF